MMTANGGNTNDMPANADAGCAQSVLDAIKSNQESLRAQKLLKELKEKRCGPFKRKGIIIQYSSMRTLIKKKLGEDKKRE